MHNRLTKLQYFGKQTKQAVKNFPFPLPKVHLELIHSITQIKKAAAQANHATGDLDKPRADAIIKACNEILAHKFDDQFVTVSLQGGAGTSINMNVNEVIASRATDILKSKKLKVHPNDYVNMSQSTNDVNPSALKIVCLKLTQKLIKNIDHLIKTFNKKAQELKTIKKLGRTHLQDAVPTTLGAEFLAYTEIIRRDKQRIQDALKYLYDLNLGGTAIGNSINASPKYIKHVYQELKKATNLSLKPATSLMAQTSSQTDFCHLSAAVNIFCLDLSKIATDLRLLASGPKGGLGEITLKSLQPGSSIMPGKVNPVIPESINQVSYHVAGKNVTIHQSAKESILELAIMFPLVADSIITALKVTTAATRVFADKCIKTLTANKDQCREHLENSTAYATLLVPHLGYDSVSNIVKQAIKTNTTIRKIVLKRKLLSEKEFDMIVAL